MNAASTPAAVVRFRRKLQVAILLAVVLVTIAVLYDGQRRAAVEAERAMRAEFHDSLAVLRHLHALRNAALLERCRELVRRPRLHAALEDDAVDLLYPSARDELRDLMAEEENDTEPEPAAYGLHAEFYRFLDPHGAVIPPGPADRVGVLTAAEEAQLGLPKPVGSPQLGTLVRSVSDEDGPLFDLVAMPIRSSETGEGIATLVLGFEPAGTLALPPTPEIVRGVWTQGRLFLAGVPEEARTGIARRIRGLGAGTDGGATSATLAAGGEPNALFIQRLNPGSLYPPVYEVCLYSLAPLRATLAELRWRVLGTGGVALLVGLLASQLAAGRLVRPVARLALDSEQHRLQRRRAEAELEQTSEELQRAARFSADASHQLKTPVAVLRAGLEELQLAELSPAAARAEIEALIRQTHRLSDVIEDLLLLSRLDAGRLKLDLAVVDLVPLIEAALDDLSARPERFDLAVEAEIPPSLAVAGEKRFAALILQNLLENAGKYNRPGGRVRITAAAAAGASVVTVGNTGRPIPRETQSHVFERFHRGRVGENVPGYGLGLNLARELARLHGGDLRLRHSADDWTEFEVRFRSASPPPGAAET